MPKFPFDKFVYAARKLGTQMKATGEVMAIGQNFEEAILKAARGLEVGVKDLNLPAFVKEGDTKIRERVAQCTDQRIFAIYQALKRKLLSVEEIHEITKIDEWFLWKLEKICEMENERDSRVRHGNDTSSASMSSPESALSSSDCALSSPESASPSSACALSLSDCTLSLSGLTRQSLFPPRSFKMVDTCAGEFDAETPYFYSTTGGENEAEEFLKKNI